MTNEEHMDASAALGARVNTLTEGVENAVALSALLLVVATMLETAPELTPSMAALQRTIPQVLALMLPEDVIADLPASMTRH